MKFDFKTHKLTYIFFIGIAIYFALMVLLYKAEQENPEEGTIHSLGEALWYSIVTLTTVGYGDIAPVTPLGQFLSAILMIVGYGIIAVPTGIVSAEIAMADVSGDRVLTLSR